MSRQKQSQEERQEKAEYILEAAAGLILRWGYNRTTIDDIARQAGIAKGTIYLYWKTREDLFRALMKRERLMWTQAFIESIRDDPQGATLRAIMKHSALALMKRPLLRAVVLHDLDVLGKLAANQHSSQSTLDRLASFKTYLEVLRSHGSVRTDLSVQSQSYIVSGVFMGFLVIAPVVPDEMAHSDEALADLISETVHRALEPEQPVSLEQLQPLFTAFMEYINHQLEMAKAGFHQELE